MNKFEFGAAFSKEIPNNNNIAFSNIYHTNRVLKRPGEFDGLHGPRGPEKKSAKSEVHRMNLIKVRKIRGPRNEFL